MIQTISKQQLSESIGIKYALCKPINQLLVFSSDRNSFLETTQEYENKELFYSESIIWIPETWSTGEGGFIWKGKSSLSGKTNFLRIDWSTRTFTGYVAQFTNLNNDYIAYPGYFFELYDRQGGTKLREHFMRVCAVADEDWHSPPHTVYDRSKSWTADVDFAYVVWWLQVGWS